ncbi:N-acetylglucosamine kinase [Dictyobacter halimunensis]
MFPPQNQISGKEIAHDFFLGLDSGGSKTYATIVDAEGKEVGHGLAEGSNFTQVGLEVATQRMREAIEAAARAAGCSLPVGKAWLGVAGVARQEHIDALLPKLSSCAEVIHITNDAELGLCALEQRVGVAVIAGTGSIVLGRNAEGRKARAGGWGYLLGNEGSGYTIGQNALVAALQFADGRGQPTALLDLILREWHLSRVGEVISQVYAQAGRATVARLSRIVFEAARAGDQIAQDIIERNAYELARTCNAVCSRLDFSRSGVPLALVGGLFVHEIPYRERVLDHIRERTPLARIEIVSAPSLWAARAARALPLVEHLADAQSQPS